MVFGARIIRLSFRSYLKRQVNEAVRIGSSQADVLLNSKSELHQATLTKMVAISGLDGDQGKDQWQALSLAGAGERLFPVSEDKIQITSLILG